ncbi:MAG: DNA topoisomerase [Fusobacterium sp.]|uniref:DNA topoisomerase n=1 Tax=Fusobacterium sp. TaxID=68766 RepID=UPI0026DB82A2|nr:DNA topoisomerase [Fusobacterium sp.]MDO4690568.1 DNA topoisomerase [Fusobacterium sp.]
MQLIIAEKEDVANEIARALPGEKIYEKNHIICMDNNYIICWASGHLLRHKTPDEIDEKYKSWRLEDLPIYFDNWEKTEIESNKKYLLYTILKLLKDERVDTVINAGDADQEGQYLIDEILEYGNNKKPVRRLFINDGSVEAVKKALNKIENNDSYVNLGKAAYARSIADMIVGFNLSRFYSITNNIKGLSIGRVQTPTLALVVNRDEEIKNHIKEKYYELYLKKEISNCELKLKNSIKEKIMDRDEYSWTQSIKNRNGR